VDPLQDASTVQQEFSASLWILALKARGGPVAFTKLQSKSIDHLLRWARLAARA
jgi:hypothetical protein